VFIVDDILLAEIVLPYARRLLGKGQDQLYDWLDKQGVKLARRGWRLWRHKPSDVEVLKDLGYYAEKHPGAAGIMATAAITTGLQPAAALPAPEADERVLRALCNFLTGIFEMVQALGHPAVLPGFLTGTDDLAVIDVRTPPGVQLEMPVISGQDSPEITLWRPLGPAGTSSHWLPRLWVLARATDADRRTYEDIACDLDTTPQQLAEALKDQPFVTGITRRHVLVQHAQIVLPKIPPVTKGESSRIPWAQSPAGVRAMLAALTSQLGERQDEDRRWLEGLEG